MQQSPYWFDAVVARQVLAALDRGAERVELSVDLNRSVATFLLAEDALHLDAQTRLHRDELQQIAAKGERIFLLEDGYLAPLEIREGGYVKLVPTEQAPLLEISGVKMHISKGINPFASAGQMAAQVVKRGDRVLDTCSGLGYAATAALELGAAAVVSVELSPVVMELRRKNPWSQGIFGPGIELVQADIATYIATLVTASFDAVIHDPPRFSLAGELYGEAFYRELGRILTRRGTLFHYTGNPQLLKRGSSFVDHAIARLHRAGFSKVRKVPALMGIVAGK